MSVLGRPLTVTVQPRCCYPPEEPFCAGPEAHVKMLLLTHAHILLEKGKSSIGNRRKPKGSPADGLTTEREYQAKRIE
jgi:hypothetical protein